MRRSFFGAVSTAWLLTACGGTSSSADEAPALASSLAAEPAGAATVSESRVLPTVMVYKDPTCGCCAGWVEHLRAAGFPVDVRDSNDLPSVKRDAGVPEDHTSCHTALVDGYVVEGHVPADVMRKLLAERPNITGIAVPGMPIGSPGMEGPGARPYSVLAWTRDGESTVYAEIDPRRQQGAEAAPQK